MRGKKSNKQCESVMFAKKTNEQCKVLIHSWLMFYIWNTLHFMSQLDVPFITWTIYLPIPDWCSIFKMHCTSWVSWMYPLLLGQFTYPFLTDALYLKYTAPHESVVPLITLTFCGKLSKPNLQNINTIHFNCDKNHEQFALLYSVPILYDTKHNTIL